jgi:hypothetical protein
VYQEINFMMADKSPAVLHRPRHYCLSEKIRGRLMVGCKQALSCVFRLFIIAILTSAKKRIE